MSLKTNLESVVTRIATEFKSVRTSIGTLSSLTTTAKTNIVAAINELQSEVDAAVSSGVGINDTAASTSSTYSSTKIDAQIAAALNALIDGAPGALDTLNELAAAVNDDATFAASVTSALAARVRTDTAAQGLTGTQQSNARTNIAAAAATHTHGLNTSDVTGTLPLSKGGTGGTDGATARTNLDVYSKTEIGDPETNLVTVFEAGLV